MPGSVADKVTEAYRKHLFGSATLQDLPLNPPRFVINATNVQDFKSSSLFRFSAPSLLTIASGLFLLRLWMHCAVAVSCLIRLSRRCSRLSVSSSTRRRELRAAWRMKTSTVSRFLPTLSSPTAVSTTISASKPRGRSYQTVLVSNGGGKMTE